MSQVRLRILPLFVGLAFGCSIPVAGQNTGEGPEAIHDAEHEVRQAAVIIDGEILFSVRGITAWPADRRAREIADKIREAAKDPNINAKSLTVEAGAQAARILADGKRIMFVLDQDAALEELERNLLVEVYRARIWEAIEAYRRDRRPKSLGLAVLQVLAATVLLLSIAYVGRRIVAWLHEGLERRYGSRLEDLEDRALHIVTVDQVWRALAGLLNFVWGLGIAIMVFAYFNYVLALFPWTRAFARDLFGIALNPLRTIGLGLVGIIPNIVFLLILALVTRYGLKIIRLIFDGLARRTLTLRGFDPDWAWPTYRLVRFLVIVFAVIVAYPYIPGSESAAFKGVSLFMGIVFSLGSSSLMGNFIAGYGMTYRKAFRLGDRVRIGEHIGDVERVRLLVTHLRTPKNEEVIVPNSTILGGEIINYSSLARESGLILHTTVGIGYETPWRQVEAMLIEAATRTTGLRQEPPPFVLQKALGDFCVTYEINAYCDTPSRMAAFYSALHANILDVFNEYGVQIMTPAYEGDPKQPKIVPKDQWYTEPARRPEHAEPPLASSSR